MQKVISLLFVFREITSHMWCKFPLMPWLHHHTCKQEETVGGFFLPNNSRYGVELKLVFAVLHPSCGCPHFLVAHLQTPWFCFSFHEVWNKGLAHSWHHRQQINEFWLQMCVPLWILQLYGPSTCLYFGQNWTFTSIHFSHTSLNLVKNDPDVLRQGDQQMPRLSGCISCIFLWNQAINVAVWYYT